jgi:hypothetical protein
VEKYHAVDKDAIDFVREREFAELRMGVLTVIPAEAGIQIRTGSRLSSGRRLDSNSRRGDDVSRWASM